MPQARARESQRSLITTRVALPRSGSVPSGTGSRCERVLKQQIFSEQGASTRASCRCATQPFKLCHPQCGQRREGLGAAFSVEMRLPQSGIRY